MKKLGFAAACKDYFGLKDGQKLVEFQAELKALTEKDRADLTAMLGTVGYDVQPSVALAA